MTRDELFEWLNSCPTHKYEIRHAEEDYLWISFKVEEAEMETTNV
tara:strand:- start:404 stop:538 length:135 start_codon:yes stop_codon:yes gene_type:complete